MKVKRFQAIRYIISLSVLFLSTFLPLLLYFQNSSKVAMVVQSSFGTDAIILIAFESWIISRPKLEVKIQKVRKIIFFWLSILLVNAFLRYLPKMFGASYSHSVHDGDVSSYFFILSFLFSTWLFIFIGVGIGKKEKFNLDIFTFSRIKIKWFYAALIWIFCLSVTSHFLWSFAIIDDLTRILMDMFLVGIPSFLLLIAWIWFSIDKRIYDSNTTTN